MIVQSSDTDWVPVTEPAPVYPPLARDMRVCLMANEQDRLWLVHDQPFRDNLHWVEYDDDLQKLTLVLRNGMVQDYGHPIPPEMRAVLRRTQQIFTMLVQDGDVRDSYILPLLNRQTK